MKSITFKGRIANNLDNPFEVVKGSKEERQLKRVYNAVVKDVNRLLKLPDVKRELGVRSISVELAIPEEGHLSMGLRYNKVRE